MDDYSFLTITMAATSLIMVVMSIFTLNSIGGGQNFFPTAPLGNPVQIHPPAATSNDGLNYLAALGTR